MPVLEYPPPASPPSTRLRSPLSPSSTNKNPPALVASSSLKPALKSPTTGTRKLPDENQVTAVRFQGSSSPNTWQGGEEEDEVEPSSQEERLQDSQQSMREDVSMDLQSEDGGVGPGEFRTLRGGGGGPTLSASGSCSSVSSASRERVPLHGQWLSILLFFTRRR